MKLFICKNKNEAAKKISRLICKEKKKKKKLVLGLATGKTMIPIYKQLVRDYKKGKISFENVITFNLDEYYGMNTFKKFLIENFVSKVNLNPKKTYFLESKRDSLKTCVNYERKIENYGGIDILLLGIGRNGHIAFNEPYSSIKSRTRRVTITKQTAKDSNSPKREALTIGISTILKSKKIILAAFGREKADIVSKALFGRINCGVPASFLRRKKNLYVFLDREASSKLRKTYNR